MPDDRLYYIQDKRTTCGNCVMWWRQGRAGYTAHLELAEVFTEAEAMAIARNRATDVPWPKDVIDSIAGLTVDHQRLPDRAQLALESAND